MGQPLDCLDDLWDFQQLATSADILRVAMPETAQDLSRPKLLICHDYKGGYTEHECTDIENAYTINQWAIIDTFVYFSHHLVTIPPAQWIAVAHLNGTQVLGTFIAEHDEGAAICNRAFVSPETACRTATQLAAIAAVRGFEGWLINLEVELNASLIPHVILFLSHLTTLMRRQCGSSSLIIWYDAITKDGKLEWQNTLNTNNDCFLTACDGLFTNYAWKAGHPEQASAIAGRRKADVYFGTDVYGRGTFGGGGMKSGAAVAAAQSEGYSAALFAPGWVSEAEHCDELTLQQRQQKFWSDIAWNLRAPRAMLRASSFYTNFDQGCGLGVFRLGRRCSDAPWYDLTKASIQPLQQRSISHMLPGCQEVTANVTMACAFDGGSCCAIVGSFRGPSLYVPLFATDIQIAAGLEQKVKCTMTAACHVKNTAFSLVLRHRKTDENKSHDTATVISFLSPGEAEYVRPLHEYTSYWRRVPVADRYAACSAAAAAATTAAAIAQNPRMSGGRRDIVAELPNYISADSEWHVQEAELCSSDIGGKRIDEIGVLCHHRMDSSSSRCLSKIFSGHIGSIAIE